jgi:UPF0271 protein
MKTASIDLNCDLGEGFGQWVQADDLALLELVSSANVACGFHAGDPAIMSRVCARAAERDVVIGAHVGYRDLHGFGRRPMVLPPAELRAEVIYQIGALAGIARACGSAVRYVKPHGALYNASVDDQAVAEAVVDAIRRVDPALAVLGPPDSLLLKRAAQLGLTCYREGFADRGYTARGTLIPRGAPGAVIETRDDVLRRTVHLSCAGGLSTEDGGWLPMSIDSLCLHSDTPGAVELARSIRRRLDEESVTVESFIRRARVPQVSG